MSFLVTAAETLGSKFSSSILGYYNLWSYFDNRLQHKISSLSTHRVATCQEFYNKLFDGSIKHGDRVILKEFFISEWIPRAPGAVVNRYASKADEYSEYPTAFTPMFLNILSRHLIPPVGSVRFPLKKNSDIILSAVTAGEYNTDMGIVLSVSKNVYSEFLSKQQGHHATEATIEGYVDFFNPGSIVDGLEEFNGLSKQLMSQPYVVRINSPLQAVFRSHNSHPRFTAWMMRRKVYREQPVLFYRVGDNGVEKILGDNTQFDFYYWPVLTNEPEEIAIVREMLITDKEGTNFLGGKNIFKKEESIEIIREIKKMKERKDNDVINTNQITEFDGRTNSTALIPLQIDPRLHPVSMEEVLQHVVKIEQLLDSKC